MIARAKVQQAETNLAYGTKICFLVTTFVIAHQRKVLREAVSSFLAPVKAIVILFSFIAFCIVCSASEQTTSPKTRSENSRPRHEGAQGVGNNHNHGSSQGATSTAYQGQGVGSTYNARRETGSRTGPSSRCKGGGAVPNQTRNHARPAGTATGPGHPNGYSWPNTAHSGDQHAHSLPGLTPELSQLYQQSIDAINRQYHRDMDRIKRQHTYALNQNQLAFEHQHHLYMQQEERRWQEEQHRRRQWQHYQQRPSQDSRPKSRRSSRSSRLKKHYDILGIRADASASDIRRAYKRSALRWHPDKPGGCGENFRQIQESYEILSADRERRRSG